MSDKTSDSRVPSIRISHVPSMLIQTDETAISRADPLKSAFRKLFEFLPPYSRGHVVAGIGEFIGTIFFIVRITGSFLPVAYCFNTCNG